MTPRELQEKWACSEYIDRWKPGGSGKVEAQQRSVSSVMTQTERTYHRHYKTPRDGDLPAGQHGAWRSCVEIILGSSRQRKLQRHVAC
eukprot:13431268-Alexandrium_andersonii.AAC.1